MKFKIGNMKAVNIINGIFITGLVYFLIFILNKYSFSLYISKAQEGTLLPDSIELQFHLLMLKIQTHGVPIIILVLFKLVCEAFYKFLRAFEIIIEKYNKNKDS
ncbi:hypothetical protein [Alkaliphilus peptidifermentans]|uniref:Uncharacterized protein n=1 Tax=Alkaliphilus peptidifermentans DSM 18978 TaxID=1120976 RepID=A0A1G5GW60_9FIRM|nr:hypothetical protein [Alkaliphilus peptidifermentans]SCY55832.1 hypothetical protein SAMN03080606_01805 [Alkaliphilus peptidifermentans DSM 18978]